MNSLKQKTYFDSIKFALSLVETEVKNSNAVSFTDMNLVSEDFLKAILNEVHGYKLENMNIIEKPDFPAIDLGDSHTGIAIQVTSKGSRRKIVKTIKKFAEKELYKKYPTLMIWCLVGKQKTCKGLEKYTKNLFPFDYQTQVLTNVELLKTIRGLDIDSLKRLSLLFKKHTNTGEGPLIQKAKEINTLATLINYLSSQKQESSQAKFKEEPDPEGKIRNRFADHADFLEEEMREYIPQYSNTLATVQNELKLGPAQFKFIRSYLRQKSDAFLTKYDNSPKIALNELVEYLSTKIGEIGIEYDEAAIRFYLIHEIIVCNVFPNK